MNQQYNKNLSTNEEVDLSQVFNNFSTLVKKMFINTFLFLESFIIKAINSYQLIGAFLGVGAILGGGYFYLVKPYYESSMTISSKYFKNDILNKSVESINQLCEEENYKTLSYVLEIPEEKAKTIKGIEIEPVIPENFERIAELYAKQNDKKAILDSLLLFSDEMSFRLTAQVYDISTFKILDSVLVNYMRSNSYIKKRIAIDHINLVNMKAKLESEANRIDSLKLLVARNIAKMADRNKDGSNNFYIGSENTTNPIELIKEDLSLYNRALNIDKELYLNAEVEIVESFIPFKKSVMGGILINILRGAAGGLVVSLIITFALTIKQFISKAVNNEVYNHA
jgi:hypothetical protein